LIINGTMFNCELEDVLTELQSQVITNGYPYLRKGFKRSGDSLQVQCPFHGDGMEKHPSYGMRRSDGVGHCFACNCVHSLPEFISACFEKNDVLGKFGWRWLCKNFMTVEVEERQDIKLDFNRKVKQVEIKYASEEELDKYRYYHPYWRKRGIVDNDIIELFDLGFDKDTNSITFPVRDKDGNCLFVARRSVKTKFFNYPEGVEKPLYGLYELYAKDIVRFISGLPYDCDEIMICESMIDCILLWQAGHYAVALNGVGNELQMKQLRQLPCRSFILATDNDERGMNAREYIKQRVSGKMFTEIRFPQGIKDIGECSQEEIQNILQWERI